LEHVLRKGKPLLTEDADVAHVIPEAVAA
jgi:hypothetical protein